MLPTLQLFLEKIDISFYQLAELLIAQVSLFFLVISFWYKPTKENGILEARRFFSKGISLFVTVFILSFFSNNYIYDTLYNFVVIQTIILGSISSFATILKKMKYFRFLGYSIMLDVITIAIVFFVIMSTR